MVRVRCLKPPVINRHEGVLLGKVGDTHDLDEPLTHWWNSELLCGTIEIVETGLPDATPLELHSKPEDENTAETPALEPQLEAEAKHNDRPAKRRRSR